MTGISGNGKVSNSGQQIFPKHFITRGPYLAQKKLSDLLSDIRDYGKEIKDKNNLRVVFPLLEIVNASDFQPDILEAAKKALKPIKTYKKGERPFEQFGFILKHLRPPYYVGALFELLPEATALNVFKKEYLSLGPPTYVRAGQSLLRFSSADKAAEFIRALKNDKDDNTRLMTAKLLKSFRNMSGIRDFPWRRYDVDDVQHALKELDKKPK